MTSGVVARTTISGRSVVAGRPKVSGRNSSPTSDPGTPDPPVLPPLPNAPAISGIVVSSVTTTSFVISWTVDQPAQGWVSYGTANGGPYGTDTTHETSYNYTSHSQAVSGLTPNTTYYYKISATNSAAQNTLSSQQSQATAALPEGIFPPIVTTLAYSATPSRTAPSYLATVSDPTWGTQVTMISAAAGTRHRYSSRSFLSCDESYGFLDVGQRTLINGQTLAVLDGTGSNTTGGGIIWSSVTGNLGYANGTTVGNAQIRRYTVTGSTWPSPVSTSIAGLSGVTYETISFGGQHGVQDDTDTYMPFTWRQTTGSTFSHGIGTLRLADNIVIAQRTLKTNVSASIPLLNGLLGGCAMSHDANYFVVSSGTPGDAYPEIEGTWVYDPLTLNPATSRQLTANNSHWDLGVSVAGDQVAVMSGSPTRMFRLSDGATTDLLTTFPNGHVSCRNSGFPGWVLMSTFASTGTFPGRGLVFYVELKASPRFIPFAHDHGGGSGGVYTEEPQACPTWSGNRIAWAGTWDGGADGLRSYVVGMDVIR